MATVIISGKNRQYQFTEDEVKLLKRLVTYAMGDPLEIDSDKTQWPQDPKGPKKCMPRINQIDSIRLMQIEKALNE